MSRYTDVETLLEYLDQEAEYVRTPGFLQSRLDGAESFVGRYTRRLFWPEPALVDGSDTGVPVSKSFLVRHGQGVVQIPDLRSATGVDYAGSAIQVDYGYSLGGGDGEPSTFVELLTTPTSYPAYARTAALAITGRWGWLEAPPEIVDAVYNLAARMVKARDANYSDQVALPESGIIFNYFRQIPAEARAVVNEFRVGTFRLVSA